MREGFIEKGYMPEKSDYEKIRKFTRRDFGRDELYVFEVSLCNNDVDRDNEKFSVSALKELAKQFVGKTGIKNHSMRAEDQSARIFDAYVERVPGKKQQTVKIFMRCGQRLIWCAAQPPISL